MTNDCPLQPAPRRKRSRLATQLPARLTTLLGTETVVLSDISLTGAKICFLNPTGIVAKISRGKDAVIEWENFEAFGKLVWTERTEISGEAGIHFDTHISPETLIATRDLNDQFCDSGGLEEHSRAFVRSWVEGSSNLI